MASALPGQRRRAADKEPVASALSNKPSYGGDDKAGVIEPRDADCLRRTGWTLQTGWDASPASATTAALIDRLVRINQTSTEPLVAAAIRFQPGRVINIKPGWNGFGTTLRAQNLNIFQPNSRISGTARRGRMALGLAVERRPYRTGRQAGAERTISNG